jgi:hypothetical protein
MTLCTVISFTAIELRLQSMVIHANGVHKIVKNILRVENSAICTREVAPHS